MHNLNHVHTCMYMYLLGCNKTISEDERDSDFVRPLCRCFLQTHSQCHSRDLLTDYNGQVYSVHHVAITLLCTQCLYISGVGTGGAGDATAPPII